jgi:hypothetical protein
MRRGLSCRFVARRLRPPVFPPISERASPHESVQDDLFPSARLGLYFVSDKSGGNGARSVVLVGGGGGGGAIVGLAGAVGAGSLHGT